jgi:pilus assembly protein CpaD
MLFRMTKPAATALALTLGLSLAGCASQPSANRSLDSVKQPVIDRSNYSLDVDAPGGGLSISEQRRLDGWFAAMDLSYGDRISIDDPLASVETRQNVAEIAGRYGLLLSEGAPVTGGLVGPGKARVVITRSKASVPGCPDWEGRAGYNFNNATHDGFGCAVNGNIAAMVADPEHLIHGATGTGETVIMTSNKAIASYREQPPTGKDGLKATSSASSAGGN